MTTTPLKTCAKCGGTEFYAKGGCKACGNARMAAWRKANPLKAKAAAASWRAENPEKVKATQLAYDLANRQKRAEKASNRRAKNPEKYKAAAAAYRAENADKARASSAAWRVKNRNVMRIHEQNRRAKKRENGGLISKDLSGKLFKLQKGKCPCCAQPLGDDFHLDHIIPIALGGAHADSNMQLLRSKCNHQKHAKHPIDFMQSRGFLL